MCFDCMILITVKHVLLNNAYDFWYYNMQVALNNATDNALLFYQQFRTLIKDIIVAQVLDNISPHFDLVQCT